MNPAPPSRPVPHCTDVYTRYVRAFPAVDALQDELEAEVWRRLRADLRRVGLTGESPRLIGYPAEAWDDARDDLVADFVLEQVVHQMARLRVYALTRCLGALLTTQVRNFVQDRQRRGNPVGYRLFCNLREVLAELAGRGEVRFAGGARAADLTAGTVVFGAGAGDEVRPAEPALLRARVEELTPPADWGWLASHGRRGASVMAGLIRGLLAGGVGALVVGELLAACRAAVDRADAANRPPPARTAGVTGRDGNLVQEPVDSPGTPLPDTEDEAAAVARRLGRLAEYLFPGGSDAAARVLACLVELSADSLDAVSQADVAGRTGLPPQRVSEVVGAFRRLLADLPRHVDAVAAVAPGLSPAAVAAARESNPPAETVRRLADLFDQLGDDQLRAARDLARQSGQSSG